MGSSPVQVGFNPVQGGFIPVLEGRQICEQELHSCAGGSKPVQRGFISVQILRGVEPTCKGLKTPQLICVLGYFEIVSPTYTKKTYLGLVKKFPTAFQVNNQKVILFLVCNSLINMLFLPPLPPWGGWQEIEVRWSKALKYTF